MFEIKHDCDCCPMNDPTPEDCMSAKIKVWVKGITYLDATNTCVAQVHVLMGSMTQKTVE